MTAKSFYWAMGIVMVCLFWLASWTLLKGFGEDSDPTHYTYMAPTARAAEFNALKGEVENIGQSVSATEYFSVLKRFRLLEDATRRAKFEESATKYKVAFRGVIADRSYDTLEVSRLTDKWVDKAQREGRLKAAWDEIEAAKKASGIDDIPISHPAPIDPRMPQQWALFYGVGMVFALGHFMIRTDAMNGKWWRVFSDLRFYGWLLIWPGGVFRYPKEIDIKLQLIRMRRLATLVITSCLSFGGAGCAGKRVKSSPDKKEAPYAFHVDVATSTLNHYMGLNGGIFHPAPIQASVVTVSLPQGFYLGAWHSMPIGKRTLKPNYAHEVDIMTGWSRNFGKYKVSFDGVYVGVTPLGTYSGDVIQFIERIGRDFDIGRSQTLGPYVSFTQAAPVTNNTPKRGFFYREGVRWGWKNGAWSGSASSELTHDSGAFGFDPGFLTQGAASISKKFGKHWRGEVPFRWSKPISKMNDGRKFEFEMGFTLIYSK